jgi:hypothetical protein
METIFVFVVATFISIGFVEEVVVPAGEYAIEKGTEVYDTVSTTVQEVMADEEPVELEEEHSTEQEY